MHRPSKFAVDIFIRCRDIYILRHLVWPPSAIMDLLGEVVGPPTKSHSLWLSLVKKFHHQRSSVKVMFLNFFTLESRGPKISFFGGLAPKI